MKTYSAKLRDPRWAEYRERVFYAYGQQCESCGESKPITSKNHIHHKRYHRGYEPWDYDLDDVCVLCPECHEEIHNAESSWRDLIRKSPSWLAFYFQRLADELLNTDDPCVIQQALVHKRHAAEKFKCGMYGYDDRTIPQILQEITEEIERRAL